MVVVFVVDYLWVEFFFVFLLMVLFFEDDYDDVFK